MLWLSIDRIFKECDSKQSCFFKRQAQFLRTALQFGDGLARRTGDSSATSKGEWRTQAPTHKPQHVSWGMNIVLFTLAPKFYPSVAFYYSNSLNLSYGHLIYLFFCVVFKLFTCYLASATRLKGPGDQGPCFPTGFVTIAASNHMLSSRETSVNPCKVESNWLRGFGHLDPGPGQNPQNLLVLIGSDFTSHFSVQGLSCAPPETPNFLIFSKAIFIFAKFLGISHLYCLFFSFHAKSRH